MQAMSPSVAFEAYELCLAEAASDAAALMRRVVSRAGLRMPESALRHQGTPHATAILEAAAALMRHRETLAALFQEELAMRIVNSDDEVDVDLNPFCDTEGFTLVDSRFMCEDIELMRLGHAVEFHAQAALVEFDALMTAAQGLWLVRARHNPLGSAVYAQCLHRALHRLAGAARHRPLWMHYLGDALGRELAQYYPAAARQLRERGVHEAGYMVKPASAEALQSWARA